MNGFTYDSNVKRFKELAKQYYKMQSEIRHLKEKIQSIDDRLLNYHSPTWDKIGSTPSRHELDVVGLIADKQDIEEQLQKLEGQCAWIQKCIDRIQDPYSRTIANLMYLGGYSINDISQEYSITPRHVFETTKDSLEQSLTDDLMLELMMLEDD